MILLAIMDGWGLAGSNHRNAILEADPEFINRVAREFPGRPIFAHGEYVGLPQKQMGNSEVGHLNIGGGRKIRPDLVIINNLIENGGFFRNEVLLAFVKKVKDRGGRLHLMGLLSDGGIHSHINHLDALLKLIDDNGPVTAFLHPYLDGRDTEPKVADVFIRQVQAMLDSHPDMYFGTIGGRSWGMDRDKNWPRVETHYRAIVKRESPFHAPMAIEAVEAAFNRNETDEFVTPAIIDLPDGVDGRVLDGDGIIHFNFRADRAIQMTRALTDENFTEFDIPDQPEVDMVAFTLYEEYLNMDVAFVGEILHDTLVEVVTGAGMRVMKIAETEKWAHVTKFFNGGIMEPFPGEDRHLVQSPLDVRPHYDKKPEMSAYEIVGEVTERIKSGNYDLIVLNFANADMVGHTGNFDAAVKAIQTVDICVRRVYEAVRDAGGTMIITADHGNAEEMTDNNGKPATKHTTNPVPFFILDSAVELRKDEGALCDIAPTILHMMDLPKPDAMTGRSLII